MAAEKAAKPPHPSTPAFRPAAKTHARERRMNTTEYEYKGKMYAGPSRVIDSLKTGCCLHTAETDGASGYTTAVHCVLPVRLASVLQITADSVLVTCFTLFRKRPGEVHSDCTRVNGKRHLICGSSKKWQYHQLGTRGQSHTILIKMPALHQQAEPSYVVP